MNRFLHIWSGIMIACSLFYLDDGLYGLQGFSHLFFVGGRWPLGQSVLRRLYSLKSVTKLDSIKHTSKVQSNQKIKPSPQRANSVAWVGESTLYSKLMPNRACWWSLWGGVMLAPAESGNCCPSRWCGNPVSLHLFWRSEQECDRLLVGFLGGKRIGVLTTGVRALLWRSWKSLGIAAEGSVVRRW